MYTLDDINSYLEQLNDPYILQSSRLESLIRTEISNFIFQNKILYSELERRSNYWATLINSSYYKNIVSEIDDISNHIISIIDIQYLKCQQNNYNSQNIDYFEKVDFDIIYKEIVKFKNLYSNATSQIRLEKQLTVPAVKLFKHFNDLNQMFSGIERNSIIKPETLEQYSKNIKLFKSYFSQLKEHLINIPTNLDIEAFEKYILMVEMYGLSSFDAISYTKRVLIQLKLFCQNNNTLQSANTQKVNEPSDILHPQHLSLIKEIKKGLSYKNIGKIMNLSESRIKGLAREIREKLNADTTAEAIEIYNNIINKKQT